MGEEEEDGLEGRREKVIGREKKVRGKRLQRELGKGGREGWKLSGIKDNKRACDAEYIYSMMSGVREGEWKADNDAETREK